MGSCCKWIEKWHIPAKFFLSSMFGTGGTNTRPSPDTSRNKCLKPNHIQIFFLYSLMFGSVIEDFGVAP